MQPVQIEPAAPISRRRPFFPHAMVRFVRWLPFAAAAFLSLALATLAPDGRRPFDFDWEISPITLAFSLSKANHIAACATLAFLALLAAGRGRWRQSMALTVLV